MQKTRNSQKSDFDKMRKTLQLKKEAAFLKGDYLKWELPASYL
jgi:hypothetical protein